MKLLKTKIAFLLIFLIAIALRFFQLGTNPPSLDWDEASLGYNAYSILKTGSDEYGNHLPISIRSFNDYKPPAYVYLTIPSVAVFGLNEFSVRLPSAIMGVLAVVTIYFLTLQLFPNYRHSKLLALSSMFLLAISPWHLQFSRAAFESNIALTFYLLALLFFTRFLNQFHNSRAGPKTPEWAKIINVNLIFTAIFATAALYSYHSARLVVPLTFLILGFVYQNKLFKQKFQTISAIILGLVLLTPLIFITFRGTSTERFNTVSIFTNPGEFSRERERVERNQTYYQNTNWPLKIFYTQELVLAKIVTRNYFEHFNFDFIFLKGDGNARHSATGMGLLYFATLPILLYGAYLLVSNKHPHKTIIWIILISGPAAASLTSGTPHAIRAMLRSTGNGMSWRWRVWLPTSKSSTPR